MFGNRNSWERFQGYPNWKEIRIECVNLKVAIDNAAFSPAAQDWKGKRTELEVMSQEEKIMFRCCLT